MFVNLRCRHTTKRFSKFTNFEVHLFKQYSNSWEIFCADIMILKSTFYVNIMLLYKQLQYLIVLLF